LQTSYGSLGKVNFLLPMVNYNCLTIPYVAFTTFDDMLTILAEASVRNFDAESIERLARGVATVLRDMLKYQRQQNKMQNSNPVASA